VAILSAAKNIDDVRYVDELLQSLQNDEKKQLNLLSSSVKARLK